MTLDRACTASAAWHPMASASGGKSPRSTGSAVSLAVITAVIPAVERRRRDKINNWIVQLSKIIPDCNADNSKTGAVSVPSLSQKVFLAIGHGICPGVSQQVEASRQCSL